VKRLAILILAAAAALVLPSGASARVIELGAGAEPAASKCPENPCEVVGRVTGYQGRSGNIANPFVVPRDGKIVAFTITLSKLEQNQINFFSNLFGSPPEARLSILRRGTRRKTRLNHRLVAQSPIYEVEHYLGSSPTFALDEPLRVRRRQIVALTVPTWAPAFASRDLSRSNWWRSSRRKGSCDNVSQRAAQETLMRVAVFGCTYYHARLLYTATYIPDPQPTDGSGQQPRR
jgi:hypothetical protein